MRCNCMMWVIAAYYLFIVFHAQALDQTLQRTLHSYKTCNSNEDCKENSKCDGNSGNNNGLCKCNDGYLIIRSRQTYECVRPAESVGSSCTHDEQCEFTLGIDSECDANLKCNCMPNAHFVKNKNSCYKTARLNETCVDHANCVPNHLNDEVFCTNGKCTCGLKQAPNAEGKCVVVRKLGEICDSNDYCRAMNAVCRVVCTCRNGYVLEQDERFCLPAATNLFDVCTQQSQCQSLIPHSECLRGSCQCMPGFHQFGNNCYEQKSIGSLCKHKGECITRPDLENRVDCVNNICLCKPGLNDLTCGDNSATSRLEYYMGKQLMLLICGLFLII